MLEYNQIAYELDSLDTWDDPTPIPTPTHSNAPVTHTAWACETLPDGLTLSSTGLLSGHPTTAGTYDCIFSVATNWGTATKTVRIVVA